MKVMRFWWVVWGGGQVQAQNQEIQSNVKETERMLRAAESARLEVMSTHESLAAHLARLKQQAQVRPSELAVGSARVFLNFQHGTVGVV